MIFRYCYFHSPGPYDDLLIACQLVVVWIGCDYLYSRRTVIRWGEANGFHPTECEIAPTWRQVFGLVSRKQWRFRFVVRDEAGAERTGFAWCGGFLGLFGKRVAVEWD